MKQRKEGCSKRLFLMVWKETQYFSWLVKENGYLDCNLVLTHISDSNEDCRYETCTDSVTQTFREVFFFPFLSILYPKLWLVQLRTSNGFLGKGALSQVLKLGATFYSLPYWQKVNETELAFHQDQHWKLGTELPLKITRCMCFYPWHTGLEISPFWVVQLPRNSRKLQLLHWPENGFNLYCFILPVGNYPLFSSTPARKKIKKFSKPTTFVYEAFHAVGSQPTLRYSCFLPLSKVWTVSLLQGLLWHINIGHSTDKFMSV